MERVLGILFLSLSNTDIEFAELEKLILRFYTAEKTVSTTSWIELINKKEFVITAPNKNSETLVVHIAALEVILIYLSQAAKLAAL